MTSLCEANHNGDAVNNSPCDAVGRLSKLVVTVPPDIPLTDAEKSVLSKGLSFVPVGKTNNEYQAKDDCESLYRRLRLKAYYHNNGDSDFRSTRPPDIDDPFAKFNPKVYTWTWMLGQLLITTLTVAAVP